MDLELYSIEEIKEELARREELEGEKQELLKKLKTTKYTNKQKQEIFDELLAYHLDDIEDYLNDTGDNTDTAQYAWEKAYMVLFGKDIFDTLNHF